MKRMYYHPLSLSLYIFLLLLRSNPSRQQSKVLYRWGVRRRGKTGKHRKVGEKKVMGFSSASLFPERKWKAVTQGGTRGIDHPM